MSKQVVNIIGSGLAGSEAAYFLAEKGIQVRLYEMRPKKMTPAHQTDQCAELVCSNSFKSHDLESAPGILKQEMTQLNSLILKSASETAVPGGQSLSVDRKLFSQLITETLKNHPNVTFVNEEVSTPSANEITLIATGPLTSPALSSWLASATNDTDLYFYDAIAPIIDADSINKEIIYEKNRYDKGEEAAYLNCPMSQEQYETFLNALSSAEKVPPKNFEKEKFFQGCQPIEAFADNGKDTLRYGPMKPVGLENPKTGKIPYAAVQLRPENKSKTAYNLVGFQTKLKYGEQKKVFQLIPGLEKAKFIRLGSIHRNTYVCGPKVLRSDLSLKGNPKIYLAGQITGVEGYLESSACGMLAALFIYQRITDKDHLSPPINTALGALLRYITGGPTKNYQPTNINFSLLDPMFYNLPPKAKKDLIRKSIANQSIENMKKWYIENDL